MTTPLSCCIIVKDEADRIGACIEAVADLADEVVVVDSGSTDGTGAIAERLGARVIFNAWSGYGPQKRFAEQSAKHDWILNLDADEIVTPPLRDEIRELMHSTPALSAYRFRIRNVYPGQTEPRLWADNHNYVRLYDRRAVSFRNSAVHDTVDTRDVKVGQLKGSVTHFSARSYEHIKQKLRNYTDLQAKVLNKPAWQVLPRLPFEYPIVFLRYYFLRCHFTGGWDGIYTSHIAAEARVQRLLKMLAAHNNQATQS
jgi:glycosyltransferase involved in cell wall biosynthesis